MIAGTRSIPPGGNSLSVVHSGRMTSRGEHLRASSPESWKRFSLARGSWRTSRPLSTPGSRHYRHGYFDPDPTTLGGRFSRVDSWVRARRQGCLARAKRSSRDRFVETRRSLQVREPNTSRRRHTRAEDSQSSSSRAGRRPHHFRESQSVGVGRGFLAGMKSPTTQ
jgi:hypothetical protein